MNNRHRRVARLKPQEETARQLLAEIDEYFPKIKEFAEEVEG